MSDYLSTILSTSHPILSHDFHRFPYGVFDVAPAQSAAARDAAAPAPPAAAR